MPPTSQKELSAVNSVFIRMADEQIALQDNPMKGSKSNPEISGNQTTTISLYDEVFHSRAFSVVKFACEAIVESSYWVAMMTVFTIWALFDNDIRLASTNQNADLGFEVVISIVFFFFLFEILAQSAYKEGYWVAPDWAPLPRETNLQTWIRRLMIGSFYYWLDWIATLSLITEVSLSLQAQDLFLNQ